VTLPSAPAVEAFQQLVDEHLGKFVELSTKIGGDVAALAPLLLECVAQSKALIAEASRAKKPADIQPIIKPLSDAIAAVTAFQGKSRDAKLKNNVYGIGEGVGIFSWVVVEPAPAPFAGEMVGAAKFYTNKILQEHKGKDETQVAWTHAWVGFAEALVPYIKKYHTTGLAWNPRGETAKTPSGSAAGAAPAAAAPKPAAAPKAAPAAAAAPVKGAALFGELNKGGDITSGLKKITRDQTNKGASGNECCYSSLTVPM
jgi:adenylyl cyclase-associated protein